MADNAPASGGSLDCAPVCVTDIDIDVAAVRPSPYMHLLLRSLVDCFRLDSAERGSERLRTWRAFRLLVVAVLQPSLEVSAVNGAGLAMVGDGDVGISRAVPRMEQVRGASQFHENVGLL